MYTMYNLSPFYLFRLTSDNITMRTDRPGLYTLLPSLDQVLSREMIPRQ